MPKLYLQSTEVWKYTSVRRAFRQLDVILIDGSWQDSVIFFLKKDFASFENSNLVVHNMRGTDLLVAQISYCTGNTMSVWGKCYLVTYAIRKVIKNETRCDIIQRASCCNIQRTSYWIHFSWVDCLLKKCITLVWKT